MVDVKNDIGGLSNLQSLATLARALGGEVSNGQIRAPGPGHSAADRSLSVMIDAAAPDGFVCHSFAEDDPITCKDYVRTKCGLGEFKPNDHGHGRHRAPADAVERALMAAMASQGRDSKPPTGRVVATYDYTDPNGVLLYQVVRLEPKEFRQRRPDGKGGWIWKLDERRVLYRWPDLLKFPDATIFVTEGWIKNQRSWDSPARRVAHRSC